MRLSKNITTNDIECNCGCGFNKISTTLIEILQDVRDHFNKPLHSNTRGHSACRCAKHNKEVGGLPNSKHQPDINGVGRACDFEIEDTNIQEVYDYLNNKYPKALGIGIYNTFIHLDDRFTAPHRWDNRG